MSAPRFLLVRASALVCALPVQHVSETLRPVHVAPLGELPVLGAALIRGAVTPVIDLGCAVTGAREVEVSRFVLLRSEPRAAALAVGGVLGVRPIGEFGELPPLLENAGGGAIQTLGALDRELIAVLRASRLVPETVWAALPPEVAP